MRHPDPREDRPLCQVARADRPGPPPVLRDVDDHGRRWPPGSWSRATRAAPPRSRATPTTRRASARPTSSPRRRPSTSTTPTARKVVLHDGEVGTWDDFLAAITADMTRLRAKKGAGLRILTGAVSSPSLAGQIKDVLAALPEARWHRFEAVDGDNARGGSKLAFGEYVDPVYHFDKADVILSLDADFLACGSPGRVSDERAFAARRDAQGRGDEPPLRRRGGLHEHRRVGRPPAADPAQPDPRPRVGHRAERRGSRGPRTPPA